jgi:Nuclease-related domain
LECTLLKRGVNINSGSCAGKSTHGIAKKRGKLRKDLGLTTGALIFFIGFGFIAYLYLGHPTLIFSLVALVLFFLFIVKMDRTIVPIMDELMLCEGNAVQGAKAEEKIGHLLDSLGSECVVVHDVNKGKGNIDHLVFRKDGAMFLVETKSHYGKIAQHDGELCRNGRPLGKNFIAQTYQNIFWLKEFLQARLGFEPWIHAVIVFSNGHVEKYLKIKGVAVINASFLSEWVRRQPGNSKVAAALWPEIENLKSELLSFAPNRLAPQASLS